MPQMARKPFIENTMGQPGGPRQGLAKAQFGHETAGAAFWLIILNALGLRNKGDPSFIGAACDPFPRFWPAWPVLAASAASADSRVFIIENQADGYGVDQCLAKGEKCGAHAARSYCQSRDLPTPRPIAASIPMRSRARYRNPAPIACAAAATNMSPSPASAERRQCAVSRLPHRRPGNDVTLPREAGIEPRWPLSGLRYPRRAKSN